LPIHTNSAGDVLVYGQARDAAGAQPLAGRVYVRLSAPDAAGVRGRGVVMTSRTPMPSVGSGATLEPFLEMPMYPMMLEDAAAGQPAVVRFRADLQNVPLQSRSCLARARSVGVEPQLDGRSASPLPSPLDGLLASGSTMRTMLGSVALDGHAMGDGSSNRGWMMLAQVAPPEGTSANDLALFAFEEPDRAGGRLVARESALLSGDAAIETVWSSNGLADGVFFRDGYGRVVVCGRGLTAPSMSNADVIVRWTRGETASEDESRMLLRTGSGLTPPGSRVSALGWRGLSVNSEGQIAFVGREPADAVYVLTDDLPLGVVPTRQTPALLTCVVGQGSAIENLPATNTLALLAGPPAISNAPTRAGGDFPASVGAGYIASRVFISNASDNSVDTAICVSARAEDGSWRTRAVIREGQRVPGLRADVVIDDLRGTFANAHRRSLSVNVRGQVLVFVPLRGAGVTTDNNGALVAFDPRAGVQLLHRKGTAMTFGGEAYERTRPILTSTNADVNIAGQSPNLTDAGECVFAVELNSATSLVVSMQLPVTPVCDSIDFDNDELFPEDGDLVDFLVVLAGGQCERERLGLGPCNDIDFNNDGLFPSDDDVVGFLRVLAGGSCP
jgi:hypothetical protein